MNNLSNISVTGSFALQISCPSCPQWYLLSSNSLASVYHRKPLITNICKSFLRLSFCPINDRVEKLGDSPTINKTVFAFVSDVTSHINTRNLANVDRSILLFYFWEFLQTQTQYALVELLKKTKIQVCISMIHNHYNMTLNVSSLSTLRKSSFLRANAQRFN